MKIEINVPEKLIIKGEEIEIFIKLIEGEVPYIGFNQGDDFEPFAVSPSKKAVIRALDLIFNDPEYLHYSYMDLEGNRYTYPGNIKKVIQVEVLLYNNDISSAKIGRIMKYGLGLTAGNRKNQGIPYFKKDNDLIIEFWKNKIVDEAVEAGKPEKFIPAEELAAAKERLATLDRLEPECNWDSAAPNSRERLYRRKWKRVMDEQGVFESKYC